MPWYHSNVRPRPTTGGVSTKELPHGVEPPSFAKQIKPLFRAMDRQSMSFAFDLWSYPDVVKHDQAILARLRGGTMPCDGAWPKERVDLFDRWVATGTPE